MQSLGMESKFGSRRKAGSTQAIFGVVLSSLLLGALLVGYFFYWRGDDTAAQGGPQAIAAAQDGSADGAAATSTGNVSAADQRATVAEVAEANQGRSEEHTSALQYLMRSSYAVFCLNKKKT